METDSILKLHQNDFKMFTMKNCNNDEIRAIRAVLPKFRKDQPIQYDWMESLDNKIDTLGNEQVKPKAPKKPAIQLKLPKIKPGAPAGDIFAEIRSRGNGGIKPPASSGNNNTNHQPTPKQTTIKAPPLLPPKGPPKKLAVPEIITSENRSSGGKGSTGANPEEVTETKNLLYSYLNKIDDVDGDEKQLATDTRLAVTVLKKLVVLTKLSLPSDSQKLEDNASRTVLCVKAVLAARQKK